MEKKTNKSKGLLIFGIVLLVLAVLSFALPGDDKKAYIITGIILLAVSVVIIFAWYKKTHPVQSSETSAKQETVPSAQSNPKVYEIKPFSYFDFVFLHDPPAEYVAVDVETTGIYHEKDRITEVAAVRVKNGEIIDRFVSFVHCDVDISSYVSELTGITNEMLIDAPSEGAVMRDLISFLGSLPIVGYNVSFDLGFIYDASARAGLMIPSECFDALEYAKRYLHNGHSKKLFAVAEDLHIDTSGLHRALADAETTVRVVEALRPIAERAERIAADQLVDYHAITPAVEHFNETNPLYKKRVVFTGLLSRMSRLDACQIVADLGGEPWNSVTKGTSYLVVGEGEENPFADTNGVSVKMRKAEEWRHNGSKIKTISESEFFDLISDYVSDKKLKES